MSDVNLSISADVVQPIIEAKITAAVMDAMKGTDRIISDIVTRILCLKVDNEGKVSSYSSSNSNTYLGWMIRDVLYKATQEAVHEVVAKDKDKIKAEIEKQIRSASTRNKLVAAFFDSMMSASNERYRLQVNFEADTII